MERRATREVEEASPLWDARENEIIMEVESYLQQSERIRAGIEELQRTLRGSTDEVICVSTIGELVPNQRGHHRFVVNAKPWRKEVADAARSAEQARNEEGMNRMAELKTTYVATDKVSGDTGKTISELEGATVTLCAENSIRKQD